MYLKAMSSISTNSLTRRAILPQAFKVFYEYSRREKRHWKRPNIYSAIYMTLCTLTVILSSIPSWPNGINCIGRSQSLRIDNVYIFDEIYKNDIWYLFGEFIRTVEYAGSTQTDEIMPLHSCHLKYHIRIRYIFRGMGVYSKAEPDKEETARESPCWTIITLLWIINVWAKND